jgi:hypothetical protein
MPPIMGVGYAMVSESDAEEVSLLIVRCRGVQYLSLFEQGRDIT